MVINVLKIPQSLRNIYHFLYVDEVLKIALKKELKRVEWTEVENISKTEKDQKSQASIQ